VRLNSGSVRSASAPSGPAYDEPDHSEQRGQGDDDRRRNGLQADGRRLLVHDLRDLLGRSENVPQLIHVCIPTMCIRPIRTELSVG